MFLDDPALGLDPIVQKQFNRDLITHLQCEGRTVFYSSHLLYEVEPVIDRLQREGVDHRVINLDLDKIFEAYVMARITRRIQK